MAFRKILLIVTLFYSFVFLTSCEQKVERTTDPPSTGVAIQSTLPFRITWADYSGRGQAIQKIVNDYNEGYGDSCTITTISGDEDSAAIQALLEGNTEAIYVLPYRYVQYFGEKGYLIDLTADFNNEKEMFYQEVWNLGTVAGKTYGIPWLGHSMCLLYNQNLLDKAGVNVGSINNLDALVEAIVKVEENTDAQGIGLVGAESNDVSWMVNQFIYGFGGSLVSDDGTAVAINSINSKSALAFYKKVLGEHAQSTWLDDTGVEVMTYFRNQEVAFEIQGIWGITDILKNGSPFEVGAIAMEDIGLCSEVGPMMLAIPANMSDEMQEEAMKFIDYLISKDAQEKILNGEYSPERDTYYPFRTPIRIDMGDSQILKSYPEYLVFIEGFRNPSIDVPVPAWQTIKDELYETGLHEVMTDEITIDEFLEMIETEGNSILNLQY